MIRPLLLVILVAAIVWAVKHVKKQPPESQQKKAIQFSLYGLAILVLGLAITGKLHWIAGAIAALLPVIQRLFFLGVRVMPFLSSWQQKQQQKTQASTSEPMNRKQALQLFGLSENYSKAEVVKRHRELMVKNHPDKGGSDYLASQINQAKEILLREIA